MAPKSAGSVSSYGKSSEASSANGSDTSVGVIRGDSGDGGDLLSRGQGSRKEAFFSAMYFIFSGRLLETDWRFLLLSSLYTWAQLLNLLFGPNFFGWNIDWNGNNWWRFYKRLLLSNAAVERGWGVYVGVVLVFIIASMLTTAIPVWLNFVLKTRTKLRWKWPGHLLRVAVSIVRVFKISIISLLTVSFTCNNDSDRTMFYFPELGCFVMPQVILFFVCLVVELLLIYPNLLGVLIQAGDTNYHSKNFFSTSVGSYLMRLSVVRMLLPLVPMAFQLFPKWQAFFNFVLTSYYLYITIRRAPMHRTWLNCAHSFMAFFPWWAASLALIGVFYNEYWHRLTTAFLAGMFPLGLACAGITYWRLRFIWDVAELFKGWTPRTPRKETYRFWDEYEVEMIARVCRKTVKTDQLDIIPDPYYTTLADKVVQAGLIQFPDSAFLNIVYASLQAVLLNDPSGGSTQLQKAKKCTDLTWVQRFQVYVREQEKLAQKGKDSDQSVTFDAATWSEFSANYKAAIRSHRTALSTLKDFWRLLLRTDVSMLVLVRHFLRIPASKDAAEHSYKALMERYPNNPRVLRAYSHFLQQVKNDPSGASRFAAMANKVEEQQEESWRENVFGQLIDRKYLDDKSTRIMAMIDETLDAVVMINSEGMIQHVNQPALKMFGYRRGKADGANISALMPAPFSQQHDSFIRNYLTTRNPQILNRTVEVIGLHKLGYTIPVDACVTPVMMGGAECFLGVIKPLEDESMLASVYCTPSGTVVNVNRGFTNLLAHPSSDIIGRSISELTIAPEKANQILEAVMAGDWERHAYGQLVFAHKFGEELTMDVVGHKAGTENVTICVLELSNVGNAYTGLITVSKATGRITYTNLSFAEFVGIPADQLIKMRLHEVIAEPHAMLHQRWIKGRDLSRAPGLRCRAGRAVVFKHGTSGKAVTALLEITERCTDQGNVFNVKVAPVKEAVDADWNRLSLTVAHDGTIASHTGKQALFGLDKEVLVGKGLDVLLDAYRKEGKALAEIHNSLLQDMRDRPHSLRVAVAPRGKRTVPAVLEVVLPVEEAQEAPATMHLYRADCLEGVVELDSLAKVKKVNNEAALVFGVVPSSLVGDTIQKVLPRMCPGGRTSELLAAHGQRGGSKQKIGAPQAAEGVHPDKHPLHVSLQAAESTERPGRYLVRIIVPKPISAFSTINRAGTGAPGVGAGGAAAAVVAQPGSLRSFFAAGGTASRPATGGACPFHIGTTPAGGAVPLPGSTSNPAKGAGEAAPSSRAVTVSGAPSGFDSMAPSPLSSRPVTGGSACPINFNTEEVLSSLSFPPSSRFAIEKAHENRPASHQTNSTAVAAAVAAAAVAAAVAAADGSGGGDAEQVPGIEDGGRDPDVGYKTRDQQVTAAATEKGPEKAVLTEPTAAADGPDAAPGGPQDDAPMQTQSAMRSMTASDENGGEEGEDGGAEDEIDPAELAAKMDGVRAWLDATAVPEGQKAPAGTEIAGLGNAVMGMGDLGPSLETGLLVVPQEPAADEPNSGAGGMVRASQGAARVTLENSNMGESDTGSLVASDADDGADHSRLRRYKKAYRLLNSARARQAINRLRIHLRLVLLFMAGAHIAFFAVALVTVDSSLGYIRNIDKAGTGARVAISACTDLRSIQVASQEILTYGHVVTTPEPSWLAARLMEKALLLEETQNDIYFAKDSSAAATTGYYNGIMTNYSVYLDVQPAPITVKTVMSLWDATQRLVNAFKDVAAMSQQQWNTVNTTFSYRYAMDNSPLGIAQQLMNVVDLELSLAVKKLKQVGKITWILLGIEAAFVVPVCALYVLWLLYKVAIERFNLFSIFFFIPRPAVLALARAELIVDELADSDDDEEEVGAGMDSGGASGAISTGINAKAAAQKAAQNRLSMSRRSMVWLMLPFAVWLAVVIILWIVQHLLVSTTVARVVSLDISERIDAYFARIQFYANELCVAGTPITDGRETADTKLARQWLTFSVTRLTFYYELLLYGADNPLRPLDETLNTIRINYPTMPFHGQLFASVPLNQLLFNEQCLRVNQSDCYTKNDPYYWTTSMGLNTLTYYVLEQALALWNASTTDINLNHPSVKYIMRTIDDIDDGWAEANNIFMYVANFDIVHAVQGVVLALALAGPLVYLYLLAAPFVRMTLLESRKVAEVLSYLPQGVDIASLLEIANVSSAGGKGVASRTSTQSAEEELLE